MLALHSILVIDSHHQLIDTRVGAAHDSSDSVEKGDDLVNANPRSAQRMVAGKCPCDVFGQHVSETCKVALSIGGKEPLDQIKIGMRHDHTPPYSVEIVAVGSITAYAVV